MINLSTPFIFVQKSGSAIVSDSERERTMVHDLLELKSKVDQIISEAFQGKEKFIDMIREAFESVINRRQNKPAELIGKMSGKKLPIQQILLNLLIQQNLIVLTWHVNFADSAYILCLTQ